MLGQIRALTAAGLVRGPEDVETRLRVEGNTRMRAGDGTSYGEVVRITAKKLEVARQGPCAFATSPDCRTARRRSV